MGFKIQIVVVLVVLVVLAALLCRAHAGEDEAVATSDAPAASCPCATGDLPAGHPDISTLAREATAAVARGEGCPFKSASDGATKCPCLRLHGLPANHPDLTPPPGAEPPKRCPMRRLFGRLNPWSGESNKEQPEPTAAAEDTAADLSGATGAAVRRCPVTGKTIGDAADAGGSAASACPFAKLFRGAAAAPPAVDQQQQDVKLSETDGTAPTGCPYAAKKQQEEKDGASESCGLPPSGDDDDSPSGAGGLSAEEEEADIAAFGDDL